MVGSRDVRHTVTAEKQRVLPFTAGRMAIRNQHIKLAAYPTNYLLSLKRLPARGYLFSGKSSFKVLLLQTVEFTDTTKQVFGIPVGTLFESINELRMGMCHTDGNPTLLVHQTPDVFLVIGILHLDLAPGLVTVDNGVFLQCLILESINHFEVKAAPLCSQAIGSYGLRTYTRRSDGTSHDNREHSAQNG